MGYWSDKRVVVSGGAGFIGSHLVQALMEAGCRDVFVARSLDYDLTKEVNAVRLLQDTRPDILFHLAGLVGGILANVERPADFFYQNLTMGTFLLHHSWRYGVRKFIAAGDGSGYPEHAPLPLKESSFWDGPPHEDKAAYALAKRLLHTQSVAYFKQYGFTSILTILGKVYGPSDNFDLRSSHVLPALVRKFVDAVDKGAAEVVVWGSGRASRDFIYVSDAVRGLLLAAEKYEGSALVNISSGVETSIGEVVEALAELTGFRGRIVWDTSRPEGQHRRCLDVTKAKRSLDFQAEVGLRQGLEKTIAWYKENGAMARLRV